MANMENVCVTDRCMTRQLFNIMFPLKLSVTLGISTFNHRLLPLGVHPGCGLCRADQNKYISEDFKWMAGNARHHFIFTLGWDKTSVPILAMSDCLAFFSWCLSQFMFTIFPGLNQGIYYSILCEVYSAWLLCNYCVYLHISLVSKWFLWYSGN